MGSIVYNYKYCTRPISRYLYSGIFKDPFDSKHKIFKNRLNSKILCFELKIGIRCKWVLYTTSGRYIAVKKAFKELYHGVLGH